MTIIQNKKDKETFLYGTSGTKARPNNKCRCSKPTFGNTFTDQIY